MSLFSDAFVALFRTPAHVRSGVERARAQADALANAEEQLDVWPGPADFDDEPVTTADAYEVLQPVLDYLARTNLPTDDELESATREVTLEQARVDAARQCWDCAATFSVGPVTRLGVRVFCCPKCAHPLDSESVSAAVEDLFEQISDTVDALFDDSSDSAVPPAADTSPEVPPTSGDTDPGSVEPTPLPGDGWVDWAVPAICGVLAEHTPFEASGGVVHCYWSLTDDDPHAACPDWQAYREHVAPLIATRLQAAVEQVRARDADERITGQLRPLADRDARLRALRMEEESPRPDRQPGPW